MVSGHTWVAHGLIRYSRKGSSSHFPSTVVTAGKGKEMVLDNSKNKEM